MSSKREVFQCNKKIQFTHDAEPQRGDISVAEKRSRVR